MTEIESPLGTTSFSNPQQGQNRVLKVNDMSEASVHPAYQRREDAMHQAQQDSNLTRSLTAEEIEEVKRKRFEAQQAKKKVSSTARDRIEFLTNIGRIKDKFEMDGVVFHMQSLKSKEIEEVNDAMVSLNYATDTKLNLEVRKHILARSLYAIDDMSIKDVLNSDKLEDKLELIVSLDENLVSHMNKFYESNIMNVGRDKYSIKTQKDMEEVAEDVKK